MASAKSLDKVAKALYVDLYEKIELHGPDSPQATAARAAIDADSEVPEQFCWQLVEQLRDQLIAAGPARWHEIPIITLLNEALVSPKGGS